MPTQNIWANGHVYLGETLEMTSSEIEFTKLNGDPLVLKKQKLYILDEAKAKLIPNYNPNLIYMNIAGKNDKDYFYLDRAGLDQLILDGNYFGTWTRNDFIKKQNQDSSMPPPANQAVPIEEMHVYKITKPGAKIKVADFENPLEEFFFLNIKL